MMRTLIVIPARLNSSRLPRKLLLAETGKPLIQHSIENALQLAGIDGFLRPLAAIEVTAPADLDLELAAVSFGAAIVKTVAHPNGTSRAAEAVEVANVAPDIVVILQADEPELDPAHIRELVQQLERHPEWDCATLANNDWNISSEDCDNPNRVKVRVENGVAADFSRTDLFLDTALAEDEGAGVHIGVYAYRTEALRRYAAAGPCERETTESLEQLRALHIGLRMGVVLVDHKGHGIDTREDYDAFVGRWKQKQNIGTTAEESPVPEWPGED